jgi:threonine/homoserine/homoserine lactone efflux protein
MGLDLLPFLGVTALVMAVPGPSVLYAVSQRLQRGRTAGIVAALGLETGLLIHVLAACLGVSALIAASPSLLTVLRYAGAAYLIVLGLRQLGIRPRRLLRRLVDAHHPELIPVPLPAPATGVLTVTPAAVALLAPPPSVAAPVRLASVYRAGLLVDLLNPKTVLFFLALVPQFVPGGDLTVGAAAVLVSCVVGLGLVFDGGYAAAANGLRQHGATVGRWGPTLTGGCFLVLGVVAFLG